MPRLKQEKGRVFVPNDSFWANVDGVDTLFKQRVTRIREGNPILDRYPHLFDEIEVDYEWEAATRAPGEVRS